MYSFLSRLTIKARLTIGFAIVPIIMIALIWAGILRVNSVSQSLEVINDVNSVKQRYAINFRGSVHDRAISLRDVVLVRQGAELQKSLQEINDLAGAYQRSAELLDAIFASGSNVTADERKLLADIKEIEARTLPLAEKVIVAQKAGQDAAAHELLMREARPAFGIWLARINKFIDYQEQANKDESTQARAVADGFQQLMIILCLLSLSIAAVFGFIDTQGLTSVAMVFTSDAQIDVDRFTAFLGSRLGDSSPRRIARVSEIPRTATGKVNRQLIADSYRKMHPDTTVF